MFRQLILLAALASFLSIGLPLTAQEHKVLFVGNSFTLGVGGAGADPAGGVPAIFDALANAGGHPDPIVDSTAVGSRDFQWHADPDSPGNGTLEAIEEGDWTHIILQNYSTEPTHLNLGDGRSIADHLTYGGALYYYAESFHTSQPQVILYETWSRADAHALVSGNSTSTSFESTDEFQGELWSNYRRLADLLNGDPGNAANPPVLISPVGDAWQASGALLPASDPNFFNLFDTDLYHGNDKGYYLAAAVFYSKIYGVSPEGLSTEPEIVALSLDLQGMGPLLEQIAWASVTGESEPLTTFLVDFGGTITTNHGTTSGNDAVYYWNNVTDSTGSLSGMLRAVDGSASLAGISVTAPFAGIGTSGTQTSALFVGNATRDSLTGNNSTTPAFDITGLNLANVYTLTFYASRTIAGDNRETRFNVNGGTSGSTVLNPVGNLNNSASVFGIAPDPSGSISVNFSPTPNNDNPNGTVHLGVLRIDEAPGTTQPIVFTQHPASQIVEESEPVTFTAVVKGTPPYTIQWLRDGSPISDANSLSYQLPATSGADHGALFSVTVSNSVSSVTSNDATLSISGPASADTDALAYAQAVGLNGSEANTIDRIVQELKGTYNGADRVNTSGTNYWAAMTDAWLFDRGLNVNAGGTGGIRSLKLAHNITANGAVLDPTNGLVTDGVNDQPIAALGTVYTSGFTYISSNDAQPMGSSSGGFAAVGTNLRDDNSGSNGNALVLKANGQGSPMLFGFGISGSEFRVNPLSGSGTGMRMTWVSASPTNANWVLGAASGSDTTLSFGPSDNNFAPTQARWGWCRVFSAGTPSLTAVNTRFTAILNRTTSASERDELNNILGLAVVTSSAPVITAQTPLQNVFDGNNATFSVTATGATDYQWEISTDDGATWTPLSDDATYSGATTATLTINGTDPSMNGWLFRALVSNVDGSTMTSPSMLTIFAIPSTPALAWGFPLSPTSPFSIAEPKTIADGVTYVSAGYQTAMFIRSDGTLWGMGQNNYGQLGNGVTESGATSTPVLIASNVASVSAGPNHTMFVKNDGTLWGTGRNLIGQLGTGTTDDELAPVQVATGVAKVAAGSSHTLFLKTDGTLWGMGSNQWGQLGDGSDIQSRLNPIQIAAGVVEIATESTTNFFVKTDGTLWGFGTNSGGQLGDGTTTDKSTPVQIATGVSTVSTAGNNTLFVKTDGTLWGMGFNDYGQLGIGTTEMQVTPVQVSTNVEQVAVGGVHAFFVRTDGSGWGMGYNGEGQLADGTTVGSTVPVQIASELTSAWAGSLHTFVLYPGGILQAVGQNSHGQLGDGQPTPGPRNLAANIVTGEAEAPWNNLFVKPDGTLWRQHVTAIVNELVQVAGISGVVQAIPGSYGENNYFLKDDGTLWQLNDDDSSTQIAVDVVSADAGALFVVYLKSDGTLWGIGGNGSQIQFGDGTNPFFVADSVRKLSCASTHLLFVKEDNTLWGMGNTWLGSQSGFEHLVNAPGILDTEVLFASANSYQNLIIKTDGTLWTSSGRWSVLPSASLVDSDVVSAASAGELGSLYLKSDGILRSRSGRMGTLGTIVNVAENVLSLSGGTNNWAVFLQAEGAGIAPTITTQPQSDTVFAGDATMLEVEADGTGPMAYQWFKDGSPISWAQSGQIVFAYPTSSDEGDYTVTITNSAGSITSDPATLTVLASPTIEAQTSVQNVFSGNNAVFSVTATGATGYQWEISTDSGATWTPLSDDTIFSGATTTTLTINAVDPVMNGWLFRALVSNAVGTTTTSPSSLSIVPIPSTPALAWAHPSPISLPSVTTPKAVAGDVIAVSAGSEVSLFLKRDGTLWSVGRNFTGQLGTGGLMDTSTPVEISADVIAMAAGTSHSMFIKNDNTLWGMGANSEGQLGNGTTTSVTAPVQVATDVISVAVGSHHTLFLKSDGTLWATGYNSQGQLGIGTTTNTSTPIQIATAVRSIASGIRNTSSYFVKDDDSLWAMGDNQDGQLGDGTKTNRSTPVQIATDVSSVAAGSRTTFFVKNDGSLWGIGFNSYGQLGDGISQLPQVSPVQSAANVASVSVGGYHVFYFATDGSLWGMGRNHFGQLGNGTPAESIGETLIPGNAVAVSAGDTHTLFLMPDGVLYAVGDNTYGQLGDRQTPSGDRILLADAITTSPAIPGYNLFVKDDGTLWQDQDGNGVVQVPGISDIVQAINGHFGAYRYYLKSDGTLWRIDGTHFQNLDGITFTQIDSHVNFAVGGFSYVVYLKNDGTLWGQDVWAGAMFGNGTTPVQVAENVLSVSAHFQHFLFVKSDNTLWGMGPASAGLEPAIGGGQLETGVASAAAGQYLNAYITTDGNLWVRGSNWSWGSATLVDGNVLSAATRGHYETLYLKSDGTLRSRAFESGVLGPMEIIAEGVVSANSGGNDWSIFLQADGFGITPTITTQPQSDTVFAGDATMLEVEADGTGPMAYQWFKDGSPISWAQSAQIVFAYPTSSDEGDYTVTITNSAGSITSDPATLTVLEPPVITSAFNAAGTFNAPFSYSITATNTPTSFGATGLPLGLDVDPVSGAINGAPTESGPFAATISATNADGTGNAPLTINIAKAPATVTLSDLVHTFDGTQKSATVATTPTGLTVDVTYDGGPTLPSTAGTYAVHAEVVDANYEGFADDTLSIAYNAPPVITSAGTAGGVYDAAFGYTITATNVPSSFGAIGLPLGVDVDPVSGAITGTPIEVGVFPATISATNAFGTDSIPLSITIDQATATVTLANLSHTFDGTQKSATATTVPAGLNVEVTYNGSTTPPSALGTYAVHAGVVETNYSGFADDTLSITDPVTADSDALAYAQAIGLAGSEANTIDRIVQELKGTYLGTDRVNTSGTNYWASLTDAWLFDRGLNFDVGGAGGIRSLKLGHNITANGAVLDPTNGLVTDGVNDQPIATLGTVYTSGFTYLSSSDAQPVGSSSGGFAAVGTSLRDDNSGSGGNSLVLKANGQGSPMLFGFGISGSEFRVNPLSGSGTGMRIMWVSASPTNTDWVLGTAGGSDTTISFGPSDNNFAPTQARWGWCRVFSAGTPSYTAVTTRFTAILNRTTSASERDELDNILGLAVAESSTPVITSASLTQGTFDAPFSYTITATDNPTSFNATGLPTGLGVDTVTGAITGTPTESGTFNVTISATNGDGTGNASLAINIAKATATVTLSDLVHTFDGTQKSATVATTPSGLVVDVTYDGTPTPPTVAGNYTLHAEVVDGNYQGTADDIFSIVSNDPPVITSASDASGVYDSTFGYTIIATNAPDSFGATGLPPGLDVDPVSGAITGTPEEVGVFPATISATNAFGTDSIPLSITIDQATATVTLANLSHTFDGTQKSATATTVPAGLNVEITYNGSTTPPSAPGSHAVHAEVVETNYSGFADDTLSITDPISADSDALAYAQAVGLNGSEANTIDRIVQELKGTYLGADRANTSGTNYWASMTDAWLFDRGLNIDAGGAGGIRSLKLAHNITANGAVINPVNGLVTDGVNDQPIATLGSVYTSGFTYLSHNDALAQGSSSGGFAAVGTTVRDESSGSGGNSLVLKANGQGGLMLFGFGISSSEFRVNPLSGSGTGMRLMWVSATPTNANWVLGTANGSDTTLSFGPSDNNFAPTQARWGWCRVFSAGTPSFTAVNTRFTAILNRSTSNAERNELNNILGLAVVVQNTPPTITEIEDQEVFAGTDMGAVGFAISDELTNPNSLGLVVNSDNPTLVPLTNISLAGAGANRTIAITPAAGMTGTARVSVTVDDGEFFVTESFNLTVKAPIGGSGWWNPAWTYRTLLAIDSGPASRASHVVDVPINFTSLLSNVGQSAAIDVSTLRVVEVDAIGNFLDDAVPFQFDPESSFNPSSNAAGTVVILLTGSTPAQTTRHFQVYFTTSGTGATVLPVPAEVVVADDIIDEGQSSFRITTPTGTLYYQKQGAGFSSWVDTDGNDWINFHPTGDSAGNFRGIPNMVYPAGNFHPGSTSSTSTLLSSGPLKATIHSRTNNGLWEGTWEIYGRFARFTVLKANSAYWFLYEGTPGGSLDPATDFIVRSNGAVNAASSTWSADLSGDEWAFVADPVVGRAAFFALHEADSAIDSYRPLNGEMTVLGFGRNNTTPLLTGSPKHFTMGLVDQTAFSPMASAIASSYKDLNVTVIAVQSEAPTITTIGNQTIEQDTSTGPLGFTIGDDMLDPDSLILSANSDDLMLVPLSGIVLGGSGANRTINITPATGETGSALITITVEDGGFFVDETFTVTVLEQGSIFVSDDFSFGVLNTDLWEFVDPVGDSNFGFSGQTLFISLPPNSDHDAWTTNRSARLMQAVANYDLELEVKFESPVTQRFQSQGLLIEQDANDFIRFDVFHSGTETHVFAVSMVEGIPTQPWFDQTIADSNNYFLRVNRDGDLWTFLYSPNGSNWTNLVTFSRSMNVTQAGIFAGNATGSGSPAFTSIVDYVFNSSSPIDLEDGTTGVIGVSASGNGSVELDPNQPSYPLDTPVTLTAVPDAGWIFTNWTGDATGTTNPTSLTVSGVHNVSANFVPENASDVIEIWYGDNQTFGQIGIPQVWVNIPGNITIPDQISGLTFSVNGVDQGALSIGPEESVRLGRGGNFNAEIAFTDLTEGDNEVTFIATHVTGLVFERSITVNSSIQSEWPLPYDIDWSSVANIGDVAQVVDGKWELGPNGVRSIEPAFDRAIAIGDLEWTDYEVTVPITVHGFFPQNPPFEPIVGILARWDGHGHIGDEQLGTEWRPIGAIGDFGWYVPSRGGHHFELFEDTGGRKFPLYDGSILELETTYLFKLRVETVVGQPAGRYSFKVWEQDAPEPTEWGIVHQASAGELKGSFLLLAHHVDATFGNVTVIPVEPNSAPTISISAPGDGSIANEGDEINFAASATDNEDDDTILTSSTTWSSDRDGLFTDFGGSVSNSVLSVGTHVITASVTDSGGVTASDSIQVTINGAIANTPPTISPIPGQFTVQDSPVGPIDVTIGDAETSPILLIVDGFSDNQTLVPNANIVIGGAGTNRTVTVTPAADQIGTAFITVTVDDGEFLADETFLLTVSDPAAADADAQAYIQAVGLTGSEANTVNRIVKELKGTYMGSNRANTSGTNYWSNITDAWLFDRGLNFDVGGAGGIRSLKLAHNITANGALLDPVNGLVTDGVNDLPIATLGTVYTFGFTYLSSNDAQPVGSSSGGFAAVGTTLRDDNSGSGGNALVLKANGQGSPMLFGFGISSSEFRVNPLSGSGTGMRTMWVSASPTNVDWVLGTASGSDTTLSFGPSDNNFAPTQARWGWCRVFSAGTPSLTAVNTRFTAILNRTTSQSERDELANILNIPVAAE